MTDPHDARLRALMDRLAQGAPDAGEPPRRLLVRANRRVALTVLLAVAVLLFSVTSGIYLATRWVSSEESKPISPEQGPRAILDVISGQEEVGMLDVDSGLGIVCYDLDEIRGATSAEIRTESGSALELFASNGNPTAAVGCKHRVDGDRLLALIEDPAGHTLRFHNSESGGTLDATFRLADTSFDDPARIGRIAFLRASKRWGQHIYLMRPDGTDLERLPIFQFYGSTLAWSPDGAAIAFDRGISEGHGEIVMWDRAEGEERTIYSDRRRQRTLTAQSPDWSPDSRRLVFSSGGGDLYAVNFDGSGLQRITRSGRRCGDYDASWSPDGTRVAFAGHCRGSGIQVLDLTTGERSDLTAGPDVQPAWSPDGSRIAFTRNGEIYVTSSDGTDPHRVSRMSDAFAVDWSPDGRALVFATGRGRVAFVDVSTGEVTRLTSGPGDQSPVWGP